MSNYELNREKGPHAASAISDDDLQYLLRIVSLELAIRTDSKIYSEQFHKIADAREELEEMIYELRKDRDRMCFVASISADLDRLHLTTDGDKDEAHGMYL